MLVGGAGYQVQGIAVAWHVYELHRSPFDLGLVGLALFLPAFLFVVPAGALADARDRVRVALVALGCEAAGIVAFLAFAASGSRSLPGYLAILFTIGTARAFGTPAERSIGPSLVATADYMRVQATYTSLRQVVQIGGPAVGGVLVAFGLPLALGVALALMAAQAVAFLGIGPIGGGSQVARASLGTALDGIRFIARSPIVAGAITLDLFAVLFGGATALLPAFADGIFHVGAPGLGLLRGADGVGAALVAALVARRPVRRRIGATLLGAVAVFGFATIAFGLSRNFALSLVLLAVVGGADVVSVVIRSSLVQLGTPAEMRGRVNAVESVSSAPPMSSASSSRAPSPRSSASCPPSCSAGSPRSASSPSRRARSRPCAAPMRSRKRRRAASASRARPAHAAHPRRRRRADRRA